MADGDLKERALRAVRELVPDVAADALVPLGSGLDHTVLAVADVVVRVGEAPAWEPELLRRLRDDLGWPVPAVRHVSVVERAVVLDRVDGLPLLGRVAPQGLPERLGALLAVLHGAHGTLADLLPVDDAEPGDWLDGLDGPAALLAVLRRDVPPPGTLRVPVHNDLGAEHVLVADGRLAGVVDWSDAALGDPAVDVARLLRDLGDDAVRALMHTYGGAPEDGFDERVLFYARCAALEDLAFGEETGRREYVDNALRAVGRLFPT